MSVDFDFELAKRAALEQPTKIHGPDWTSITLSAVFVGLAAVLLAVLS
jgi:hypothetical protein